MVDGPWYVGLLQEDVEPAESLQEVLTGTCNRAGRTKAVTGTTYFFRVVDRKLVGKFWHTHRNRPFKVNDEQTLIVTEDTGWLKDKLFKFTFRECPEGLKTAKLLGLIK